MAEAGTVTTPQAATEPAAVADAAGAPVTGPAKPTKARRGRGQPVSLATERRIIELYTQTVSERQCEDCRQTTEKRRKRCAVCGGELVECERQPYLRELVAQLKAEGWPTAHGGEWRASTVYQILRRAGLIAGKPTLSRKNYTWARTAHDTGITLGTIAIKLNERGVPLKRPRADSKGWSATTVLEDLRQGDRYYGQVAA